MPATELKARNLSASLTVSDVQRSLRFYTEGLGFAIGQEWKDDDGKLMGVMLQSDNAYLMLGQLTIAKE